MKVLKKIKIIVNKGKVEEKTSGVERPVMDSAAEDLLMQSKDVLAKVKGVKEISTFTYWEEVKKVTKK